MNLWTSQRTCELCNNCQQSSECHVEKWSEIDNKTEKCFQILNSLSSRCTIRIFLKKGQTEVRGSDLHHGQAILHLHPRPVSYVKFPSCPMQSKQLWMRPPNYCIRRDGNSTYKTGLSWRQAEDKLQLLSLYIYEKSSCYVFVFVNREFRKYNGNVDKDVLIKNSIFSRRERRL